MNKNLQKRRLASYIGAGIVNPRPANLAIAGTPVAAAVQNAPYSGFTATASGGTQPYVYSLVGTWPAGVSINAGTGAVSGTPTAAGNFTELSVRVTDAASDTAQLATFALTVTAA